MTDNLRYHPQVAADIAKALNHYSAISERLAVAFVDALNCTLKNVSDHPQMYAVVFDCIRIARTQRFPYLIEYRRLDELVEILGVFHSSADPQRWHDRADSG